MAAVHNLPKDIKRILSALRAWAVSVDKENAQLREWLEANEQARDIRDGHIQVLEDTIASAGLPVPPRPDY